MNPARHLVAGKPLEPQIPPHSPKGFGGTRLIAVPNGNKLEDWAIRSGEPKPVIEKGMVPVQRSQSCRSAMKDYSSGAGLRYDPTLRESVRVN